MKWIIIAALSLCLGVAKLPGDVLAQNQVDYDNASGTNGDCTVSGPSNETLVYCKSLHPGHGTAIMNSPGASAPVSKTAPPDAAPADEPAPETTTDATTDTTVAS